MGIRRRLRGDEGYTLTEFSIAMAVFLIFMSFATPFLFSQLEQAIRTEDQIDLQQNGRQAMRTLVRELRQADALYASTEKPSGKNSISFGVDFDGSGTITSYVNEAAPLEQITYYLKNDALYRGRRTNQGVPLAEGVTAMEFTMFGSNPALDDDGDGLVEEDELNTNGDTANGNPVWQEGELANVTRVHVLLTLTEDQDEQTYEANVFMRNKVSG